MNRAAKTLRKRCGTAKVLKKRRYRAQQKLIADTCKALMPKDIHSLRARREGITREEAKRLNFAEEARYSNYGVTTGRMSMSGRNLSNGPKFDVQWLPRNKASPLMELFSQWTEESTPKKVFMGVDYSVQETRLMSQYAKEDAEMTMKMLKTRGDDDDEAHTK